MAGTTKTKTPDALQPRRCKYCRALFTPERAQDKNAKFCTPNHRKAYWRYGGLPFDKMKDALEKRVRKIIREMVKPQALND
jgi:hypothetical protein